MLVASLLLLLAALPARAQSPAFRVDPYWPKPLPHNWILGQVGGISRRRAGQYLGVSAAALADRRREGGGARSAARQMLRAGAFGTGVQSGRRRREVVGRARRKPRLRLAAFGARHPRRPQGLCLAQRQRQGRQYGVEVHHRRQIRQTNRQKRTADRQHRSEPVRAGRRARIRQGGERNLRRRRLRQSSRRGARCRHRRDQAGLGRLRQAADR